MPHFICTGECNGVSEQAGLCQAQVSECSQSGQPLQPCECTNQLHDKDTDSSATGKFHVS